MAGNDQVEATVSVKRMFMGLQRTMVSKLMTYRQNVLHSGIKGDGAEDCWREMLSNYLPKRYRVAKAQVLDHLGRTSEQIDVVVFDRQYTPFLFTENGVCYVPAESVYAVFEVKQEINSPLLREAGKKAKSVRGLARTSAPIPHAGGVFAAPAPRHILGGILALDCSWADGLGSAFHENVMSLGTDSRLDLGCSLSTAAFHCTYGRPQSKVRVSNDEEALITFFLTLVAELQKMGTVPAMDLTDWTRDLSLPCLPVDSDHTSN